MRTACGTLLAIGLLTAARADPPKAPDKLPPLPPSAPSATKNLRAEREALDKASDPADAPADATGPAGERAVLRAKLLELVKKLEQKKMAPPPAGPTKPGAKEPMPPPRAKFEVPEGLKPVDAVRLAQNLYRADEIDAALRAFRLIDVSALSREDRAFVQYMTACCLRKTGKLSEAAVLYREVADAKEDEFLTECAVWQLQTLRSSQELEAQLEQLRARRKGR